MKLLFLKSKNFLSLDGEIFFGKENNLQKRIIIVGPNNVGKTNIVRALKFIRERCEHTFKGSAISFVNKYSKRREFELEIGYRLDEEEKRDLELFLEIYINYAVKFSNSDIENIKKGNPSINNEKIAKERIFNELVKLSRFISSIVVRGIGENYPVVEIEFNINGNKVKLDNRSYICKINTSESPTRDIKEWLRESKDKKLLDFILEKCCLSLGNAGIQIYEVSNKDRERLSTVLYKYNYLRHDFDRRINLYYFILHMFASRIILLDEIRPRPLREFEDEVFKEEINKSSPHYYSTGENLALFLYKLKNSERKEERDAYQKIKDLFKNFTGLEFDISYTLTSSSKGESTGNHKLDIWIINGKNQISIDYAGSGLLEALNIFSTLVGNRNCIIILDEPVLHLHPSKQRQLIGQLKSIVEENNNQFIIITHSPYVIETNSLEDVIRFDLEEHKTKVYPLAKVFGQISKDKVKKEFVLNPHYRNMLFARGVIIVEGECEEIGVPFLLQKAGFSLEEYDIEVFNAHGDRNFETPAKIAENLKIPYVIVCDSKAFKKENKEEFKKFMFSFEQADFIDFLKEEFKKAWERIETELNKIDSKPQKTIRILQELKDEEIKESKKLKKLAEFIKEKLEI